jgi:hypothetical protein
MLRDVFVHRDVQPSDAVRARALQLVMPSDAIIAGRTAAWLQGVWRTRPGVPVPLEYARPRDVDGRGILGASLSRRVIRLADDEWSDVTEVAGVPVMSPMRTCFDLMRERALVEAVVVADAYARSGQLALPWLAAYVRSHDRWPGVRVARDACEFASALSRSTGESRLRMVVVLAGFPVPLVNPPRLHRHDPDDPVRIPGPRHRGAIPGTRAGVRRRLPQRVRTTAGRQPAGEQAPHDGRIAAASGRAHDPFCTSGTSSWRKSAR